MQQGGFLPAAGLAARLPRRRRSSRLRSTAYGSADGDPACRRNSAMKSPALITRASRVRLGRAGGDGPAAGIAGGGGPARIAAGNADRVRRKLRILPHRELALPVTDSSIPAPSKSAQMDRLKREEAGDGFRPDARAPGPRQTGPDGGPGSHAVHHGASHRVRRVVDQHHPGRNGEALQRLLPGQPVELPAPMRFSEYAASRRPTAVEPKVESLLGFASMPRRRAAGVPLDRPRPALKSYSGRDLRRLRSKPRRTSGSRRRGRSGALHCSPLCWAASRRCWLAADGADRHRGGNSVGGSIGTAGRNAGGPLRQLPADPRARWILGAV